MPKGQKGFWEQVAKGSDEECWPWIGTRYKYGYGRYWKNQKHHVTHRLSFEEFNGPIPDGLHICHRCDNPPCVNPHHLFLGTNVDNVKDRVQKNRTCKGTKRPNAKLTEQDVWQIRDLYDPYKFGAIRLGRMFNVSKQTILTIVNGVAWAHLLPNNFVCRIPSITKLNDSDVVEILTLHATGQFKHSDLAKRFNVGNGTIFRIVHGHTAQFRRIKDSLPN